MIKAKSFKGKKVTLFGLGKSGQVTAQALMAGGADIIAWDDDGEQVKHSVKLGIPIGDLRVMNWQDIDSFVLAPGVALTHPKPHWSVELARANNVEIIGDVEIFVRERNRFAPDCPFIAITGTNGKSTTTALITHLIRSTGRKVQMGGNIGTAILSLSEPDDECIYVVECSSYQIDLTPSLNPDVGILLNVTPDHLERHGSMENYVSIKERLVEQSKTAIISMDDKWCADIQKRLDKAKVTHIPISVDKKLENGIFLDGTVLVRAKHGHHLTIADINGIDTLRGKHNGQNGAAAIAACLKLGIRQEELSPSLTTFPGLEHRMQLVAQFGNIIFINDSKATNAEASIPALKSFQHIFWIAGGLAKEGEIKPLIPFLASVRKAFLIGQAGPAFAAELADKTDFEITNTLEMAVSCAFENAKQFVKDTDLQAVILFSPACASFDQFPNFSVRGDYFVDQVGQIEGVKMLLPVKINGEAHG